MAKIYQNSKLFILAILFSLAGTVQAQTYCSAAATSAADDEIFNVTFSTLNNTTNCSSLGGGSSVLNKYNDYTSLPAPILTLGSNYPLSVTVGQCGSSAFSGRVGVWIDFNQNGLFTDLGEDVFMSSYTLFAVAGTAVTAPLGVTIPFTALSGSTRMRVIETESSTAPGPCTNPTWGEVEDYTVMILSPSPLDLGVSAFINPVNSKKCFGNDTIVATVKNYGSATVDFAVDPTVLTIEATGANPGTFTLALSSGSIASTGSENYTLSTTYNMSNAGTYKFKGYTTVPGDGSALNDTLNLNISRAPFFTTSFSPNDSVCLGVPVQLNSVTSPMKQVGTGVIVNSATSYPSPFGNFYKGARHQFLYLASELTAAGLSAGNVTSVQFYATNLNTVDPLLNYNFGMATTTLTSITAFQATGFTSYFSAPSYTPVLGANVHTLATPFVWDGVSNIILETCFDNSLTGYSNNVSVTQSSTPFTSSVWHNSDTDPTICTNATISSSMNQRPNAGFGQPAVVTYSWSPSLELSASNIANPIANLTVSRTYTVTGDQSGCISNDIINIHVKPTPTPDLGNDTVVCSLPFVLNANTTADSYLWNNNTTASSLNINNSGKYWVRGTNTNGCLNADTINVSLGSLPIVTLGPDTAFCQGSTINLYAGNPGSSYLWSTGATGSFISVGTVGTYSVIVTNSTSCQSTDIVNVTSKTNPTVSLVFGGQTTFCPTDAGRTLSEGAPAGGTYIGAGVSGNTFNANQAGQGTYIIFYNYTGSNGCNSTAKDTLIVNACVGIEELTENISLNVYPNPNTGLFTLEINTTNDIIGKISVTTIDGRLVYADEVGGNGLITKSVDIASLANGIYYLRLETKDGAKTYKVLKQ